MAVGAAFAPVQGVHVMSVRSLQDSGMISYLPSHGVDPISSIIAFCCCMALRFAWHLRGFPRALHQPGVSSE